MKRLILILLAAVLLLALWLRWENTALMVTELEVPCTGLPESFSGFRIAQISDLHNAEFGEGNEKLLSLLAQTKPDIIVITGDIADSRRTDLEIAAAFAKEAVTIAPCFYVPGNHEGRIPEYPVLEEALRSAGVQVLRNEAAELSRGADTIALLGVDDPDFDLFKKLGDPEVVFRQRMELLEGQAKRVSILLSHRPEHFATYVTHGFELVFSGHAHGGQIRLPGVGGLLAPGQGFFPAYDSGLYTEGATSMVVSRGLGNSAFPFRICNRPEIILVTLKRA